MSRIGSAGLRASFLAPELMYPTRVGEGGVAPCTRARHGWSSRAGRAGQASMGRVTVCCNTYRDSGAANRRVANASTSQINQPLKIYSLDLDETG